MIPLRKKETEERYAKDRLEGNTKDLWEEEVIYDGHLYKIVRNKYPYDAVYDDHLILITKYSAALAFHWASEYAQTRGYSMVLWNTPDKQTLPDLVHVHIVK